MSHRCCDDFTRSQLLRAGAAEAGRGLPSIEPGMPQPAGTGLTRRKFISRSAGLALAVYGASKLPLSAFENGIARAAQGDKVLISIFLEGGIDTLSVLAPFGDQRYQELRPTLKQPEDHTLTFSEDTRLQWHPSAKPLMELHEEGKVATFPAIGYEHPDQSHFTSRHYYEIGELDVGSHAGWMGRYLDVVGSDDNPLQGLSMDGSLSPMIATVEKPVAAIGSVDSYEMWSPVWGEMEDAMFESFTNFGALPVDSAALQQVRRATAQTAKVREDLLHVGAIESPVQYPSPEENYFAHKLAGLAHYLDKGLPVQVVTLRAAGGYDTHSDQAPDLASGLQETCEAINLFQRDLEARKLDDRVMIEVWSEFGRRPEENGSAGTDHGAAGCAFVIGSKCQGEMVGEFPGMRLSDLDEYENLKVTADFRGMYCSLLEQWLDFEAAQIIPGAAKLERPLLVRT